MGGQPDQLQLTATITEAGKANIDVDASSRVSWLGCMPDNSGTHLQVMAAVMQTVQEAALKGPTSLIEAYSCDLHVLDLVQDSKHVNLHENRRLASGPADRSNPESGSLLDCVTESLGDDSWNRLIILSLISSCARMKPPPIMERCLISVEPDPGNLKRPILRLVMPAMHREIALKGCHHEVGHLRPRHKC